MSVSFPLKLGPNGRYLVDQAGVPFPIKGDSAADLCNTAGLTLSDMDTYIADRIGRGFNTFWLTPVVKSVTTTAGEAPFTSNDFSKPREPFFSYLDNAFSKALASNMMVIFHVAWAGFSGNPEDWSDQLDTQPIGNLRKYGRYIGTRLRKYPNVIPALWGDRTPTNSPNNREPYDQLAAGLIETNSSLLLTAEMQRATCPLDTAGLGPQRDWLKLNWSYSVPDQNLYTQVRTQYQAARVMPVFGGEYWYEGEHSVSQQTLRASAYWCFLQGGCGYVFGNTDIWQFNGAGAWQAALNSTGSQNAARAFAFFDSYPWYNLVPDLSKVVVVGGLGTDGGTSFVTAAAVPDGSLVIAYTPTTNSPVVNMSKLRGQVLARWFDPSNASYTTIGSNLASAGLRTFAHPGTNSAGANDWVLVLTGS